MKGSYKGLIEARLSVREQRRQRDADIEHLIEEIVVELEKGESLEGCLSQLSYLHPTKVSRIRDRVLYWIKTQGELKGVRGKRTGEGA